MWYFISILMTNVKGHMYYHLKENCARNSENWVPDAQEWKKVKNADTFKKKYKSCSEKCVEKNVNVKKSQFAIFNHELFI